MSAHQYILTIAGFDPSSGAGLTSDIKTFQAHGLYGLSVCTAVTVQNDVDFLETHWMETEVVLNQIDVLFQRFSIDYVKIGIVENWLSLSQIISKLKVLNPSVKIVLDPVLKASAGFDFHEQEMMSFFDGILSQLTLITPNYEEIKALYPNRSIDETIEHISSKTNLYLKGGHRSDKVGLDQLFYNKIVQLNIEPGIKNVSSKHGSGCVLSSVLASNLALGYSLTESAQLSKKYIEQFLSSNTTLLGTHSTIA
ncbi:hydroxymethylpyrimidine/phosphomethylpyrimidine kinase [Flavobacteriales bacterium]|nr:hydroxymethylpyrimidine/phosphomethylpyrimidine kinase [Flavobacteriales bacterium]